MPWYTGNHIVLYFDSFRLSIFSIHIQLSLVSNFSTYFLLFKNYFQVLVQIAVWIKTLCKHTRELYLAGRNCYNPEFKKCYNECVYKPRRCIKFCVIRLYFPLDALHVLDYVSPSSGATFYKLYIAFGICRYVCQIYRHIQKDVVRIIVGCKRRDSCRSQFDELKILPLPSQYIYSLFLFVINNKDQ